MSGVTSLSFSTALVAWLAGLCGFVSEAIVQAPSPPASRHFELVYSGVIKGLPGESQVRVWLPLAQDGPGQRIRQTTVEVPAAGRQTSEPVHGNRMLYFEYRTGSDVTESGLPFRVTYEVLRHEVQGLQPDDKARLSSQQRRLYTTANRMVPVGGKPASLLEGLPLSDDALQAGRQIYDRVESFMTYDKSVPGYGRGDVLWACDSKSGNCSDFHSLFISLARHRNIPARFEIGFPLPPERRAGRIGGYHCWAKFHVDGYGWVPVDISEADKHPELKDYYFGNLTENRVTFTRGRDLDLEPKQAGDPLNYFIYPHVEVAGRTWPGEQIDMEVRYRDIVAAADDND
jgi:transglutaminase-like putative cysteine protease